MIWNLQYLRGLAAMMVVVFHVTDSSGRLGEALVLPDFAIGQAGVDVFFVISGFIMWVTTATRPQSPGDFFFNRLERIGPLYWILTLALTAAALLAPSILRSTQFDYEHFAGSMLFFPVMHPTLGNYNPVLFVGWTLNYEMAFYLLFALALFLPARMRLPALIGAMSLAVVAGYVFGASGVAGFYTRPIILEFALGLVGGAVYLSSTTISRGVALTVFGSGMVFLFVLGTGEHSLLFAGIPAAMVVFGAAMAEKQRAPLFRSQPLLLLGNASYSIYLSHILVIPICQIAWSIIGLPVTGAWVAIYVAGMTSACAIAGIITYYGLEKPLLALMKSGLIRPVKGKGIAPAG